MAKEKLVRNNAPGDFLELFFPIHYTVGMTVEATLSSGRLTRQQTIILWLIRSKGEGGRVMRRKDIVSSLNYWFELTNSAISKALRSLAQQPLGMVSIVEDPNSGREKIVTITPSGLLFLNEMIANAQGLIKVLTDEMSDEEIVSGLRFFRRISEIFDSEIEQKRDSHDFVVGKPSVKRQS